MNDYNEAPLATLDDQELATRIRALEREVLASVRSDNWNVEETEQPDGHTSA